jgi:hypothetical protein
LVDVAAGCSLRRGLHPSRVFLATIPAFHARVSTRSRGPTYCGGTQGRHAGMPTGHGRHVEFSISASGRVALLGFVLQERLREQRTRSNMCTGRTVRALVSLPGEADFPWSGKPGPVAFWCGKNGPTDFDLSRGTHVYSRRNLHKGDDWMLPPIRGKSNRTWPNGTIPRWLAPAGRGPVERRLPEQAHSRDQGGQAWRRTELDAGLAAFMGPPNGSPLKLLAIDWPQRRPARACGTSAIMSNALRAGDR